MKEKFYRLLKWLKFGRWEYCVDCLSMKGGYHYWLINERYAKLKAKGVCKHLSRRKVVMA